MIRKFIILLILFTFIGQAKAGPPSDFIEIYDREIPSLIAKKHYDKAEKECQNAINFSSQFPSPRMQSKKADYLEQLADIYILQKKPKKLIEKTRTRAANIRSSLEVAQQDAQPDAGTIRKVTP